MTKRYIFDSHSLLAFFQREDGAETVAGILEKAIEQQMDRFICLINLVSKESNIWSISTGSDNPMTA